jgi:hypothetical protein
MFNEAAGEEGLMLFNIKDHGKLLNIVVTTKKARQYVLGNPFIVVRMSLYDIRAGLCVSQRQNPEATFVEWPLDENWQTFIKQTEILVAESQAVQG